MYTYIINNFKETDAVNHRNLSEIIIGDNEKVFICYMGIIGNNLEQTILQRINYRWDTTHEKLIGLSFTNEKTTFEKAMNKFWKGPEHEYNHFVAKINSYGDDDYSFLS
jgi:hypothetical protein